MELRIIDSLLRYRYLWAVLSLVLTVLIASAAKNLYMESDYKIFFQDDDQYLVAHEEMEDSYIKSDNIMFIIKPAEGDMFTATNLAVLHELTELGWQTPYVTRVDSLTNFQHTEAAGEDLNVASLLDDPTTLDATSIARIKRIALSEKAVVKRLITENGRTAMINITLELPPEVDPNADIQTQHEQRTARDASHPAVVKYARTVVTDFQQRHPGLQMHLNGVSVVTNSFNEATVKDLKLLVPLMYLAIVIALALFLRSFGSLVGTLIVIGCASAVGIGSAGVFGYALNTVNVMAPIIILTITVCDAVHLLSIYLRSLSQGLSPVDAMRESFRLNLQPIVLTSVTTAVGFLTLNFSISPPFVQLGNITAMGVLWAMLLTFTLLPSITMLLVRKRKPQLRQAQLLDKFSHFVVRHRKPVFISSLITALLLMAFVPLNQIDDDPITYFAPGVPYRDAADFSIANQLGVNDLNYSIDCGTAGCVNNVEFLAKLEQFHNWIEQQPKVIHVSSYVDVLKRLNRSMHRDEPAYYQLPENSALAAQYNLLYEMSLPFGLDLNNQVNIDKSTTRVGIIFDEMSSYEIINFELSATQWLHDAYPEIASPGSSVSLMFAQMGVRNIRSMLTGGLIAILGVTLTILIALKSFRYALISMVPNSFPAFMAFGLWGLLVGQVNMAVAAVFSISLGILVDDTVHFISKYRRAREVKGLSPEDAIHYAFANVGSALIVTTIVLVIGFGLLTLSDFSLNSMSGMLTSITIAIALIFDFLILPPILMFFDKDTTLKA